MVVINTADQNSSGLSSLLQLLGGQMEQQRAYNSRVATILPQIGGDGQPQPAPQQGGILSRLLGLGGGDQPAGPADIRPAAQGGQEQTSGLFGALLGQSPASPSPAPAPAAPAAAPGGGLGSMLAGAGNPPVAGPAPGPLPISGGEGPPTAGRYAQAPSGPLPTFAAAGGAPGVSAGGTSPNAQRALAFYQAKGLSPLAASALVGGFSNESGPGLNTNALARGDGQDGSDSTGIAQWNGSRGQALRQFAAANGLDPSNIDTQLQFSWAELNGPERATLQALQNANNPFAATAAAIGYERPAGWSAQNPGGAGTFGKRLASTVALAGGGSGSPYGAIDRNAFAGQAGGDLPTMTASGYGSDLSPATAFPARGIPSHSKGGQPGVPMGRPSVGTAYAASGQPVQTDADGNALDSNGRPTTLAYAGSVTNGPAQRAISTAVGGQGDSETAPGTAVAGSIAAPYAQQPAPGAAPLAVPFSAGGQMPSPVARSANGFSPITMDMVKAFLKNPDTEQLGLKLWESTVTNKAAPIIYHAGDVVADASGRPLFSIPNKPEVTDAIKNYTYAKGQGFPGSFKDYQDEQRRADKATAVDVPQPDGRMQKTWLTPGQAAGGGTPIGSPYTPKPGVSIDQKAESASESEFGKALGKDMGDTLMAGSSAPQALQQISIMRAAAAQAGGSLSTGPFAQYVLKGKQALGNALGVEIPGTSEAEAINNLGYGLATQAARAISNRPTQFEFSQALNVKPGLAQSPQGFQAVLNIKEQDLRDQQNLARLLADPANRGPQWPQVKANYYASHPIMSPFYPSRPLGQADIDTLRAASGAQGGGSAGGALSSARDAIAKGAPRAAVIQRLRQNGVDPSGL